MWFSVVSNGFIIFRFKVQKRTATHRARRGEHGGQVQGRTEPQSGSQFQVHCGVRAKRGYTSLHPVAGD